MANKEPAGATNSFDANRDLVAAFPTPMINTRLEGATALNAGLRRIILAMESASTGMNRSNVGGWHSAKTLFDEPEPELKQLATHIDALVRQLAGLAVSKEAWKGGVTYSAWANVSRRGDYNRMHNHPGAHWSGVYYVDPGTADREPAGEAGKIEFQDPRGLAQMTHTPGEPFGRSFSIRPTAGQVLIFPSFMFHCVHPYHDDGARISIAFNALMGRPHPDQTY